MNDAQKTSLLIRMGVDVYKRRSPGLQSTPEDEQPDSCAGDLINLSQVVAHCQLCELHQTRTQTVFGTGHPNAKVMFVGEAPGQDEDLKGEPFVGRAGQLLTLMLSALRWSRNDVYIANILKCRPPNNRNPQAGEISECEAFLTRQIELVRPQLLVALGRIAAQSLLDTSEPISRLRGKKHIYQKANVSLVVTYHPAYLLRNPVDKAKSWQDLLFIRSLLV